MKKTIFFTLLGVILITVIISSFILFSNKQSEEKYLADMKNIEHIDSKNISLENFITSTNENYYLYIGRKTCPNCRNNSSIIKELNERSEYKVYYYDSDYLRENKKYSSTDKKFLSESHISSVPTVLFIKDYEIQNAISGNRFSLDDYLYLPK